MLAGNYEDGPPGTTGKWTPTHNSHIVDDGDFYASKDFDDPAKGRRLNIGWVVLDPGSLSLPRSLTWHPELAGGQLMHSPIDELKALRGEHLASQRALSLNTSEPVWLGDWSNSSGKQAEVVARFSKPQQSAVFGIDVMVGPRGDGQHGNSSTRIFLQYQAGQNVAQVGVTAGNSSLGLNAFEPGPVSTLYLLEEDEVFELRVFVDHTFVEAYWMDGRIAMTSRLLGGNGTVAGMSVFSEGAATVVTDLDVWHVNSIWVRPEQVLATPRTDGSLTMYT